MLCQYYDFKVVAARLFCKKRPPDLQTFRLGNRQPRLQVVFVARRERQNVEKLQSRLITHTDHVVSHARRHDNETTRAHFVHSGAHLHNALTFKDEEHLHRTSMRMTTTRNAVRMRGHARTHQMSASEITEKHQPRNERVVAGFSGRQLIKVQHDRAHLPGISHQRLLTSRTVSWSVLQ